MSTSSLARPRSTLVACCGAHLTQDGMGALQLVLLPILAQVFSLSYAQVGVLRAVAHSAMSLLELPAGILAERVGERRLLVTGLLGAGIGYSCVAYAGSFAVVVVGFFIAGAGAALQHSLASSLLVKRFEGAQRRRALGTYNSAGDGGKLTFTAVFSAAIGVGFGWDLIVSVLALATLGFAGVLYWLLRPERSAHCTEAAGDNAEKTKGWGIVNPRRFGGLATIVLLDSMVQTVFATFLAFIMLAKGAGQGTAGAAVVLALAGGMVGKFCCGFLAARLGDRAAFVLIQFATMLALAALTVLSLSHALILLPLIGLVVQGSTTISYGAVAEFVKPGYQARGYGVIYTLASASSVMGPVLLGWTADASGLNAVLWVLVAVTGATLLGAKVLPNRSALGQVAT